MGRPCAAPRLGRLEDLDFDGPRVTPVCLVWSRCRDECDLCDVAHGFDALDFSEDPPRGLLYGHSVRTEVVVSVFRVHVAEVAVDDAEMLVHLFPSEPRLFAVAQEDIEVFSVRTVVPGDVAVCHAPDIAFAIHDRVAVVVPSLVEGTAVDHQEGAVVLASGVPDIALAVHDRVAAVVPAATVGFAVDHHAVLIASVGEPCLEAGLPSDQEGFANTNPVLFLITVCHVSPQLNPNRDFLAYSFYLHLSTSIYQVWYFHG